MSLRLTLLQRWFPRRLKLWMLDELARVTAEGFAIDLPCWPERSFDDRLAVYARFTAREAQALLARDGEEAIAAVRSRLRAGAARLGMQARRRLGLRRPEDAFEAWRLLYRQIGIEVVATDGADGCSGASAGAPGREAPDGEVAVTRCFFTGYYDEQVCDIIGALDDGTADGLFGGATLEFSERLTGGGPCCRAVLRLRGGRP